MAIRNANKEDKEYAKKLAAAKAKLAAAKAAKATPQGSVKVLPNVPDNKLRQLIMNSQSTAGTINKKLGLTAQRTASLIEEENKKPAKVVKVNSATPKRQGTTPASTPRRAGGLMGGGGAGNWRNMFK